MTDGSGAATRDEGLDAMEAEMAALAQVPAHGDAMVRLRELGARVLRYDALIERMTTRLSEAKTARYGLQTRDMIDLMDEAGVESIAVDGQEFEAADFFHASIPEESRDEAHDWLEDHDAGDLIKYQVIAEFPKDMQEEADKLVALIVKRFQAAKVTSKRGVPWARLTAWVKEQYYAAREAEKPLGLPLQLLGATVGRVVKLRESKKSKKGRQA